MISPIPSTTFTGTSVTFTWVAGAGSSAYWIDVGSTPEGNDYFQSGNLGTALTATVNGLPNDGSTVYVTLWSLVGGNWMYNEYTYTAHNNGSTKGVITSPTPGSMLSGSSQQLHLDAGHAIDGVLDRCRQHAGRQPVLPVGQYRQRDHLQRELGCRRMAARCTSRCTVW